MPTTPLPVKVIIFLNILVFFGWFVAMSDRVYLGFMIENFLVSWNALIEGRPWVLLTSVFSHNSFFHLFINMFVLRGFGTVLNKLMGTASFINFYLIAGIAGSFMHAVVSLALLGSPELPALGASGAIAGIILLFSLTFPQERLLFLGIIPIRAGWAAVMVIGIDLWGLIAQTKGGGLPIGHGAHLGGALMGIVWFLMVRNKRI
jgi:rhomboid-like protein